MRHLTLLLLLFTAPIIPTAAQGTGCPKGPHTQYSRRAVSLDSGLERIPSPDGTKVLTVRTVQSDKDPDGMHILFTVNVAGKKFQTRLLGFNAEVLWASDSSAFAVNQTEGGGGIGEEAYVFYLGESGLTKVDISAPVMKAFGVPVKCEVPAPPNVAFIDWLGGSDKILVAAEVVPVSICQCSGMFSVYEVSLPEAKILHTYSQIEAKQKFPSFLGCELRSADDKCAQRLQK
jgi:hypothetical protein